MKCPNCQTENCEYQLQKEKYRWWKFWMEHPSDYAVFCTLNKVDKILEQIISRK